MVAEWLRFYVPQKLQARYLEADSRIWTPVLAAQPGFISKQVWQEPEFPHVVIIVIHWASRTQWDEVPKMLLRATEAKFRADLGQEFVLLESKAFEVSP